MQIRTETEMILIFTRLRISWLDGLLRLGFGHAGMEDSGVWDDGSLLPDKEVDLRSREKGF